MSAWNEKRLQPITAEDRAKLWAAIDAKEAERAAQDPCEHCHKRAVDVEVKDECGDIHRICYPCDDEWSHTSEKDRRLEAASTK